MVAHLGQTTQHLAGMLGIHPHHMEGVRECSEGELLVDGHDITAMDLSADVHLHVVLPRKVKTRATNRIHKEQP